MVATLYGVANASIALEDGTVVEANTNGASALTLVAIAPPPSTTSTTIANITMGTAATTIAVPVAGFSSIVLVSRRNSDGSDDVFLIGPRGGSVLHLLVIHYRRSASGAWSEVARRAAALPAGAGAATISSLAAGYAPTNVSGGLSTIFVLGRRDDPRTAAGVFYATLDPRGVASSTYPLVVQSGDAPPWLPSLSPTQGALPPVDVARVSNGTFAIFVDQSAVVDVRSDGTVASRWRPDPGITRAFSALQTRVVAVSNDTFASVYGGGGEWLYLEVYGINGNVLARRTITVADAPANGLGAGWDVYYNPVADELIIHYAAATSRLVRRIVIPMSTMIVAAPVTVTSTFGTGGTLSVIRVQHTDPDERRVRVAGSQLLNGVESTQVFLDTSRNVAPLAPQLYSSGETRDASNPITLEWAFGDSNPRDRQTAYDLQVQRVSDSVLVVNVANVASTERSRTLAANTLANGTAYRYRVRTKDALGVYGAWSPYLDFTPSSLGTVTITSPAANDPAGLNTATINVTWTAIVPSSEPTGWVLRVYNAATGAQLHAAGSTSTWASSYNAPVPTDVRVRIEVAAISSLGTSPVATRFLTSSYSLPMNATPLATVGPTGAGVRVEWEVPAVAGSRPITTLWIVERAEGSGGTFTPLYSVPTPGGAAAGAVLAIDDLEVASGTTYTYRVAAYAAGGAYVYGGWSTIAAPVLMGAWLHRITDPLGTLQHFPYAEGRKVDRSVESEVIGLIGRAYPVIEFGDVEGAELSMGIRIPHGVGNDARVEWWRTMLRARDTLCYRDNRQRLAFCAVQGFTENDTPDGSVIDVNLVRIPFDRRPADAAA